MLMDSQVGVKDAKVHIIKNSSSERENITTKSIKNGMKKIKQKSGENKKNATTEKKQSAWHTVHFYAKLQDDVVKNIDPMKTGSLADTILLAEGIDEFAIWKRKLSHEELQALSTFKLPVWIRFKFRVQSVYYRVRKFFT
jgi:hypothetical protein